MVRSFRTSLVFIVVTSVAVACSGGGDDGGSNAPEGSAGAAGAPTPSGGAPGAGGAAPTGGVAATGNPVPPGQLTCAGRLCVGGGRCARDGRCPAFLGDCFTSTNFDTCSAYCGSRQLDCAEKSCNTDGTGTDVGYSSVSYAAGKAAACAALSYPDTPAIDSCASPIWLNPSKPADDVVRCCCRER